MSVDGKEVCTGGIAPSNDEVCANVTLVSEEMLLEHGHAGDNARLATCGKGVKLKL